LARLVLHTRRGPVPVKNSKGVTVAAVCMCGLSRKYPFCDGSHLKTREEEEGYVYIYSEDGTLLKKMPAEELAEKLGIPLEKVRRV